MDRYTDVERKRPIVQHVNAVEQESNICPSRHRHAFLAIVATSRGEEGRREGCDGDKGEL